MKKFCLILSISLLAIPLSNVYRSCSVLPLEHTECDGYVSQHPLASQVYCYSDHDLYHLNEERDPEIRIQKFIIRFGILPLRPKGRTVFEELQDSFLIPPAIKAAQGIMEAAIGRKSGMSTLAINCNNYHGIKARKGQDYGSYKTTEYRKGRKGREFAKFAKYSSPYMGMKAHAVLLAKGRAYGELQSALIPASEYRCMTPERRLEYLEYLVDRMGKYATSPTYKKDVMNTIKKYSLHLL